MNCIWLPSEESVMFDVTVIFGGWELTVLPLSHFDDFSITEQNAVKHLSTLPTIRNRCIFY